MNTKALCELVSAEAAPYCAMTGCVVWDVKYVKEAGEWYLRVLIDTVPPGNVTIDMCETVNRALDRRLDELDPIPQSYYLEVSSPGINRELYRESDFEAFSGSEVDIRLYKPNDRGEKLFTATLKAHTPEALTLERAGAELILPKTEMASCRVHCDE